MKLDKLTTILIVEAIEPALEAWSKLGYQATVRVPEQGKLDFVILQGGPGELMLQTRKSIAEDLPPVAKLGVGHALYAHVASIPTATEALGNPKLLVDRRKTFYGATETWLVLEGGTVLGLSEHAK